MAAYHLIFWQSNRCVCLAVTLSLSFTHTHSRVHTPPWVGYIKF